MKKIITLTVLIATTLFSCKKATNQQSNNTATNPSTTGTNTGTNSSNGNVNFTVYQKCSCCAQQIKNGAIVTLYNSSTDLNNGNAIYNQTTQGNGTTTFSNITPKSYYYRVSGLITYGDQSCINTSRTVTGQFTLASSQNLNKTATLAQ